MTSVVVIVPMLGRPHTVETVAGTLTETAPDARLLFVCSPGDTDVHQAIDDLGHERIDVPGPDPGDYARKINAGYRHTTEDLLFCGACDLRFHPGWLEAATARLTLGIGVVGTNDLGNDRVMKGIHSTHSLVTRDYADNRGLIDQKGTVLCELYPHEFVDDELVATAKRRRAWAFAGDSHVEHMHPHWNKAPSDPLYELQGERMAVGRRIYKRRQRLWR